LVRFRISEDFHESVGLADDAGTRVGKEGKPPDLVIHPIGLENHIEAATRLVERNMFCRDGR
jgi:hypothetical protein